MTLPYMTNNRFIAAALFEHKVHLLLDFGYKWNVFIKLTTLLAADSNNKK